MMIPRNLIICPLCGGLLDYLPHPHCMNCHEVFEYDFEQQVFRNPNIVDISYRDPYSSLLSNLYPHPFHLANIKFASMEAFLRALCYKEDMDTIKDEIAILFGVNAINVKYILPDWKKEQTLYLLGRKIARESEEYQDILRVAYGDLYDSSKLFRMALMQTKGKVLIHSIGKDNPKETLLTKKEFIHYLNMLRDKM